MRRTMVMALLGALLLALTATGAAPATPHDGSPDGKADVRRELTVKKIRSDTDSGRERRQIVIAPSARALSEAINKKVPYAGEGTYLAAFWGTKPTGGYSIAVSSASQMGDRVIVKLALKQPKPGTPVTQAFTYPYVLAAVKNLNPKTNRFYFFSDKGRRLDWPVKRVSG